jgi:hypothetical protein
MGAGNQQERPANMLGLSRSLSPDYVSGFVDGEGCFSVSIRPHPSAPHGWFIQPVFQVYQHRDNAAILEALREYLGCGTLVPKGPNSSVITYSVHSRKDLRGIVFPFFDAHPLASRKREDYEKFREIVLRLDRKEHFSESGFRELVVIAFSMNARGKQRKYRLQDVFAGIPRDCTPGAPLGA